MDMLLASGFVGFSPLHFLIGFIILVCVLAIVIIAVQWLLGLAGITIPPPIKLILGIMLFLCLFLWLISWSGLYSFGG
jgi:hypothetical protein